MPKGVKMEKYRPKIHFSAEDYIINDPNGLVSLGVLNNLSQLVGLNVKLSWFYSEAKLILTFLAFSMGYLILPPFIIVRTYPYLTLFNPLYGQPTDNLQCVTASCSCSR